MAVIRDTIIQFFLPESPADDVSDPILHVSLGPLPGEAGLLAVGDRDHCVLAVRGTGNWNEEKEEGKELKVSPREKNHRRHPPPALATELSRVGLTSFRFI